MVPGLWLEPEVIGVDSPIARELPDDAFLTRRGVRVAEHGRYLLDLRNPPPGSTSTTRSTGWSPTSASASSSSTTTR